MYYYIDETKYLQVFYMVQQAKQQASGGSKDVTSRSYQLIYTRAIHTVTKKSISFDVGGKLWGTATRALPRQCLHRNRALRLALPLLLPYSVDIQHTTTTT